MSRFRNHERARRYELEIGGGVSFANYRDEDGVRAITHVETPPALRGRGYAAELMGAIVEDARGQGRALRPICPYAAAYFKRHPEAGDVLA